MVKRQGRDRQLDTLEAAVGRTIKTLEKMSAEDVNKITSGLVDLTALFNAANLLPEDAATVLTAVCAGINDEQNVNPTVEPKLLETKNDKTE